MRETPTYPQPIIGWREWRIREGLLWPAHQGLFRNETAWPGIVCEAECLSSDDHPHSAPGVDCSCGFHAYHFPSSLHRWTGRKRPWLKLPVVMGLIAGAGLVCVHSEGFRAERAQIIALIRSGDRYNRKAQERICSVYGLELCSRSDAIRIRDELVSATGTPPFQSFAPGQI